MANQKIDPSNLPPGLNTPETDPQARRPEDLSDYEKFVAKIKGMLVGDEYEWAEETLLGILCSVQQRGIVTPGQRQAIANIADKPHRNSSQGRKRGGW